MSLDEILEERAEEARAEGMVEGHAKGKAEGKIEGQAETLKKLKAMGLLPEDFEMPEDTAPSGFGVKKMKLGE